MNEVNCIGRQTFSIREIQQEWQISLNALCAAMDDYEKDVNDGRKKSILASIVGLTTRYPNLKVHLQWLIGREYESRKQINNVLLSGEMSGSSGECEETRSPGLELHPVPPRRIKHRNMLTPMGVVEVDEVNKMVDASGLLRRRGDRRHGGDVMRDVKRFEAVVEDTIAIGQLVDLDGEIVEDEREVYSARRDLEVLTFSDETAGISTRSVCSYATSPTMSTLSSNTCYLQHSLQSFAPQIDTPANSHVLTSSNRHPENTSPSTSHFSNSPEGKSMALLRKTLVKLEPETSSSELVAVHTGITAQSATDTLLLDLVSSAAETETSRQWHGTKPSTMDDLAGLQFPVPEEAVAFDLRRRRPSDRTKADIVDRAFRMFSMGIKSRNV